MDLNSNPIDLDLSAAIANLKRQSPPKRVFLFEHGTEPKIKQALCDRFDLSQDLDRNDEHYVHRLEIRLAQFLGHEFIRVFPSPTPWPGLDMSMQSVPPPVGPIQSFADFETYAWPKLEDIDFSNLEWFERNLPDNMAMWSMVYLFQQVSNLFGFTSFCMKLYEDPDLVKAVTEKVGQFFEKYTQTVCQFSRTAAINIGDDMGYKSGTFFNPQEIRDIFIPWHKRIIAAAHTNDKLGIFHVCGMVDSIMPDLIDTVRIDAKHSSQDVIEPITATMSKWGDKVALLGGVDVDFITSSQPQDVRTYTRNILETCAHRSGFALGIGNWVADSIPTENYIAMIEETRSFT